MCDDIRRPLQDCTKVRGSIHESNRRYTKNLQGYISVHIYIIIFIYLYIYIYIIYICNTYITSLIAFQELRKD